MRFISAEEDIKNSEVDAILEMTTHDLSLFIRGMNIVNRLSDKQLKYLADKIKERFGHHK